MRSLRTVLLVGLLCAALAPFGCDGDDRPDRPKDPGPVVDDVPVVILPDHGAPDPGAQPDPGEPPDADGDAPDDPDTADPGPGADATGDAPTDEGTTKPDVCIPQCAGRNCGGNGCDGFCGMCTAPEICSVTEGRCVCVPDCNGKQCGDNGCGGSCGECPDGLSCDEQSFLCATTGPCPSSSSLNPPLSCTDPIWSSKNGVPPNGNKVVFYGGACQRYAIGAEKAYRITPTESGLVTLTMKGSGGSSALPDTLDAYVVSGSTCDGANCIAWGHDSVQFQAEAGTTYWLMVDATAVVDAGFWMRFDAAWCAVAAP